ncbi:MAG: 4-(cytidine 5'-diphospho)-2-C-methyl-D-erythritol kinase [Burkholderiaceae bacterium]|jgi:4-diphosphocytidyl-2-C-methyl-D-erythritol kinase|nr:4-(cytidine 5'-diphospho)-2-C-methyl-D-erythritol kinase [Burkholderiaceae bacterium]
MPRTLNDCPAPAKINLFLHITGQREDGYHLLQTVFQLIDFCDTLHFSERPDGIIRRTTTLPDIPEATDLTVRAAQLLQSELMRQTGRKPGADIVIEKHLPIGGGLGGGSSDAATTLLALNQLWQCHFSRAQLMKLGVQLGADVPFFLLGQNAFAEGIGEILTPIDTPLSWFILIDPRVPVPTARIFASEDLTRNTEVVTMPDFLGGIRNEEMWGRNDLQSVAEKQYPAIASAVRWLNRYAPARMTGSGACVFARASSEQEADRIVLEVPVGWKGWKARGLGTHPLDARLSACTNRQA